MVECVGRDITLLISFKEFLSDLTMELFLLMMTYPTAALAGLQKLFIVTLPLYRETSVDSPLTGSE